MNGIKKRSKGSLGKAKSPSPPPPPPSTANNYKPWHEMQESLLSSRSGFVNYRGMLNDCILCLVLSNSRYILYNFHKYGVLIDPTLWIVFLLQLSRYPALVLILMLFLFPFLALCMEKVVAKGMLSDRTVIFLYGLLIFSLLGIPPVIVFVFQLGAVGAFITLLTYTVVCMKLVSYCQVNHWCRTKGQQVCDNGSTDNKLVYYPNNLNLTDLCYFLAVPTLCYELNYPRTKHIRKTFLLRRTVESVFLLNILIALAQQWLAPTVLNSVEPFQRMDFMLMIERILILALPNHLLWLLMFYWFFHSFLNLLAEVLRFGDRCFYQDWWNAKTISEFWRQWNIPVHKWASRHVYGPIISIGYSKLTAQLVVFILSAFLHEYLISIPLKMLRPWAFTAMLAQVPLALVTSMDLLKGQISNVIVWISLVLGQPLAILMYMHDYYLLNQNTD